TDVFSTEQVLSIAKRMHMTLSSPFHIDEIEIAITPSIGVSLFPDHGTDINTLLKKADSAMYCVKRRGRNGIKMWRDSIK
ncbi:MAG: diguanylate cyclase, partial [Aminobacterium sp.]